MNIQIIEHDGVPEYAVVPFDEWESIMGRLEELEDIRVRSAATWKTLSGCGKKSGSEAMLR